MSASPRSPRYLQSASCCHTPEHVKCPLLHLPSLSRIFDLDLDLFARGPLARLPRFSDTCSLFPMAPNTLVGFLSTISHDGLAVQQSQTPDLVSKLTLSTRSGRFETASRRQLAVHAGDAQGTKFCDAYPTTPQR